jgi:hypothetical protein
MRRTALAIAALTAACRLAGADPETCRAAAVQYQAVLDEVSDALQMYAACVFNNQGDNCASEFAELQSAQDHFEQAVALADTECQDAPPPPTK